MMTTSVCCVRIADILIRFVAERGVCFSQAACLFGGFGSEDAGAVDYEVEVCLSSSLPADVADAVASYDSGPATLDGLGHTWQLILGPKSEQHVVVRFDNHPVLRAASVVIGNDRRGRMCLCQHAASPVVDSLFVFPLFNICLSRMLLQRRGFLIHASAVSDGGAGYLFTAVSGTGKSTMAQIWNACGASVVNDDMLAVVPSASGSYSVGNIPMPYYDSAPRSASLRAIFLISQSPSNFVRPVGGAAAVLRLLSNTISQPVDRCSASAHLANVSALTGAVPVFELGFRPDADIVELIRRLSL